MEFATPYSEPEEALARSKPLGSLFTQVAVKIGDQYVSLNVDDLRPADVLLFGQLESAIKSPVEIYQRLLFPPEKAFWTHCGILDENFSVWDAMPREHVRVRSLGTILRETHRIAVVRPRPSFEMPALRASLLEFSNYQYRVFRPLTGGRLAARLVRAGISSNTTTDDHVTICSLFVVNVLKHATRHGFLKKHPIALPADFIDDEAFSVLPLRWTTVEQ